MLSLVVPTLDEEKGIGQTLDAVPTAGLKKLGYHVETIVVDGGSKDATVAEAKVRGARVVDEPRRGYGRAYKTGFKEASGRIIATCDADGSYPVERLVEYVSMLDAQELDFITCDRYAMMEDGAMSAKHRLGNWVLSSTARGLYRVRLRDSQSGMWVFRREFLDKIDVGALSDGMAFSQEIKIKAFQALGEKAKEVPGGLRPRIGAPVIASWRDGFGNLGALWKGRFR